jgi:hypothetical protein
MRVNGVALSLISILSVDRPGENPAGKTGFAANPGPAIIY